MTRRRRFLSLVGESLREIGVLVVVFLPLEAAAHGTLTWRSVGFTLILSSMALGVGLWLEVTEE